MSNQVISNNVLSRHERRKQKTKEIVRKAAIEAFLELGYLNTTVQDITERADLGYGTFYQYYKNKRDIIIELAMEAWEIIRKNSLSLPESETSLYIRTISKLSLVFHTYAKHREVLKILLDSHNTDEELNRVWTQLIDEPSIDIKKDLTWSMKRGLCREVDLETAIVALTGMVKAIGVYIVQNTLNEQEIDKITKDVGLLIEKSIFVVDDCPPEVFIKTSNASDINNTN